MSMPATALWASCGAAVFGDIRVLGCGHRASRGRCECVHVRMHMCVVGNEDGNIIVAEFFDYNCGYCKKAFDGVQEVLDNEDDVKVALIELPILGPSSLLASQWSLAVLKQDEDKYWDFHRELMTFQGQKTEATLTEMAERVGLDVEQLKQDAQSEDVQNEIAANRQFAEDMGVSGTPGFVIESEVIRGYVPYDQMKDIIEAERQKKEG